MQDGAHHQAQSRPAFSPRRVNEHSYDRAARVGLRYKEPENLNSSQRLRHDELPDAWSNQSVEKQRLGHLKYPHSDKETNKRTPEGMSAYLKLCEVNKRKRRLLNGEHMLEKGSSMSSRIVSEANKSVEEESLFLPEMMLPWNCVPESALPATDELVKNQKVECFEVLDNLPPVMSMSPAMIERFGITPEYVKMGAKYRGKDGSGGPRISLSQEQARKMTQKVVARVLSTSGFEAGNETSMEVFSEIINSHICKLGRTLKILTDSYRKQFSAVELLKMFLRATGHSNLGDLAEITKSTNKAVTHQTQQNVRAVQSQNQNPVVQVPQLQRHIHPQMSMFNPPNLTLQQQQQLLWRRQAVIRGSQMAMDKDKTPSDVKNENTGDSSMDGTFKHQMQMRYPTMTNNQIHSGQQLRQLPPAQIPQPQNTFNMRTQVKAEAFNEFGSGDSTLKRES